MPRYVTIKDIALALGISKSTVSRGLSGDTANVKPETMRRIIDMADRMGYQRNEMAVNLRRQHTHTIGIIVPEAVTSFYMTFVSRAQQLLGEKGYKVLVAISNESVQQERDNLHLMEQCRVDGLLMGVCHNCANVADYNSLMARGIPIVFFDRKVDGVQASQVRMDDYIMSFFMVERLIKQGRRNIVHLAGPAHISNSADRLRGYRDALEKFHITYSPQYVLNGALNAEEGAEVMRQFLSLHLSFDAVFGFTEMALLGAKSELQRLNFHIPRDVALCCMSGTALCTLVHPSITAVEQPVDEMAQKACELLLRHIAGEEAQGRTEIMRGNTVLRESTTQ